jgi:hypothetical protein
LAPLRETTLFHTQSRKDRKAKPKKPQETSQAQNPKSFLLLCIRGGGGTCRKALVKYPNLSPD